MSSPPVGAGIATKMADYKTTPATPETYWPTPTAWTYSEAFGRDGRRFVYIRSTNQVHVFEPLNVGAPTPPVSSAPTIIDSVPGVKAGAFSSTPLGVILHSTRSGQNYTIRQEFDATVNYVRNGTDGLGWNLTVGDQMIATHFGPMSWGWNAREHSSAYLAAEFAQARVGGLISDGQVSAFVWWFRNVARAAWPNLPAEFPNHSDLAAGIRDGKSDPEPRGQHSLRDRILAALR